MLDPAIVKALVTPAHTEGELDDREEQLLQWIGEGRPVKAIATALQMTPEAANDAVEDLFLKLAKEASAGRESALRRLRLLQKAIVDREEQGETLQRMLPGGLAAKLRDEGRAIGETERLTVTVLMSDVRGYSGIAERVEPTPLAGMLNTHRAEMNAAILAESGTVMQYVGDAVMAVFGAPFPQADHAERALAAAIGMHDRQHAVNEQWRAAGLPEFGLGIGLSTGEVAAALLGSAERVEYTLVGDTVNLAQRLQDLARPAGTTVMSSATAQAIGRPLDLEPMGEHMVKGRETPVDAYRLRTRQEGHSDD
jgi:class 3 adenylate cyclase